MSKQLSIFSLLQPQPKRRYIAVEENCDEKLKNDVHNCLTRLADNAAKKGEREKKDETAKKKSFQTCKYYLLTFFHIIFFKIFDQRKPIFIQSTSFFQSIFMMRVLFFSNTIRRS